jgi:GNAT superfamily N-acetyltransferase
LSAQLGYPCSAGELSARLSAVLALGATAVFVGEAEGRVAGWIEVHRRRPSLADGDSEAEVMGLIVDSGTRRSGLGRALMEEAEGWARARGCRSVRVRTNVVRQDAHAFYEKAGYAKVKTQSLFRKALTEDGAS